LVLVLVLALQNKKHHREDTKDTKISGETNGRGQAEGMVPPY
jgi:hypothetical protein